MKNGKFEMKNSKKIKVLVGVSGGVDSAMSVYLLKKAGFEVLGIYMKMHKGVNHS